MLIQPFLPFPSLNVKSWDALRKHAVEMLIYADPVRYEERIRSIRVSNHSREAKAYLQNMYRYEGNNRFKFACQLCHETCSSFEATEVFLKPETELDPVNLCLCPNCAGEKAILYRLRTMENEEFEALPYGSEGLWRRLMQVTATFGMCLASEAIRILTKGENK